MRGPVFTRAAAPVTVMAVVVGVALGVAFDPTRGVDAAILVCGMCALCVLAALQMKRTTKAAAEASAAQGAAVLYAAARAERQRADTGPGATQSATARLH